MVYKIKISIFFIFLFVLGFLALISTGKIETNILRTFIPQETANSDDIIEITNKTSSKIKVVFESDNENDVAELKNNFVNKIDTNSFEFVNIDFSKLIKLYSDNPSNFIAFNTRNILKEKKYDEIYTNALMRIYNPISINFSSLDKDPYLFVDDFMNSLQRENNTGINTGWINVSNCYNGKIYNYLLLQIKTQEGLSPSLINSKVSKLVKIQKELSQNGNKIYLAGSPIHSYYMSRNSIISINIISFLSVLLIAFLTYFYFQRFLPLVMIGFCILSGMLAGYNVTRLWFENFQIVTMVFSATLIGIGVDYSYHYFFSQNHKGFFKNLTISLITTVIPFIFLYMTGIELLKQIAVFTVFGLLTIYITVILFFPIIEKFKPIKTININKKTTKIILLILGILGLIGFFRFNLNDSITSLYSPNKQLQRAENLYKDIFENAGNTKQIIKINGKNLEEILIKEEAITDHLQKEKIDFVALSSFIPSAQRQNENYKLVKQLYKNNLYRFSDILTGSQIENLKTQKFVPVIPDFNDLYFLKDFILNENTSLIIISTSKNISLNNVINIQADISKYLKDYRIKICKIIPIFFSIIALFMVFGFTIDYSVFRTEQKQETEDAIFVSALTTSFSFFLLSFCGFKMLSSIALILFFGILISYLTSKLLQDFR